jgi:hypothetical protein
MMNAIKKTLKEIKTKIEIIFFKIVAIFNKHYKDVVTILKAQLETIKSEVIDTVKQPTVEVEKKEEVIVEEPIKEGVK